MIASAVVVALVVAAQQQSRSRVWLKKPYCLLDQLLYHQCSQRLRCCPQIMMLLLDVEIKIAKVLFLIIFSLKLLVPFIIFSQHGISSSYFMIYEDIFFQQPQHQFIIIIIYLLLVVNIHPLSFVVLFYLYYYQGLGWEGAPKQQ